MNKRDFCSIVVIMNKICRFIILIWLCVNFSLELEPQNVTFIIVSQNNNYNDRLAKELQSNLKDQADKLQLRGSKIYISNKHFNVPGEWTIVPLANPILSSIKHHHMQWVVFLEDYCVVDLMLLMNVLSQYNHNKEIWIGHALHDAEAVIIHHFEFRENPESFKYPNLASGFAMSLPLLEKIRINAQNESKKPLHPREFHIDPAHEFALFVLDDGTGAKLTHNDLFCAKKEENEKCAIYPKEFEPCGEADISTMYFAIKTCQHFYKDRVDVVKKTYHKYTEKSGFFSDHEDKDIPTIDVAIPNVDRGHCAKMIAILKLSLKEFQNDTKLQWLILVDDDTILSVSRIAGLLACHNNPEPMILGERYGYGKPGMDYPTGGAGTLINRDALEILAYGCHCAWPSAPDDMMLGACAEEYDVTIVHVPQMHQARPNDYAPGRLATNDAITFHKHWNNKPVEIYEKWFLKDDQKLSKHQGKFNVKNEL